MNTTREKRLQKVYTGVEDTYEVLKVAKLFLYVEDVKDRIKSASTMNTRNICPVHNLNDTRS
jgi:hypothetical protein